MLRIICAWSSNGLLCCRSGRGGILLEVCEGAAGLRVSGQVSEELASVIKINVSGMFRLNSILIIKKLDFPSGDYISGLRVRT